MNSASTVNYQYIENLDLNINKNVFQQQQQQTATHKQADHTAFTTTSIKANTFEHTHEQSNEPSAAYEPEPQFHTTWTRKDLWPI